MFVSPAIPPSFRLIYQGLYSLCVPQSPSHTELTNYLLISFCSKAVPINLELVHSFARVNTELRNFAKLLRGIRGQVAFRGLFGFKMSYNYYFKRQKIERLCIKQKKHFIKVFDGVRSCCLCSVAAR